MWELAVISIILVLLILILVVVVCWISSNNSCRKNRRHIELLEARTETGLAALEAAQTVCCTKAFLTSVGGATVDRVSGLVKLVTWDSQTMNELPDAGWTPVFSTVDNSLIGWTVPLNGTYFVEYETLISTTVAAAVLMVNGQLLLRSYSASANTLTSPQLVTSPMHKSFLINLVRGDIVSLLMLNLSGPGITPPVQTGAPGRYLHTLSLDLRDASSQSIDPGADATSVVQLARTSSADNALKAETTLKSAVSNVEDMMAQNVEQWLSTFCVQQAITNGASCAIAAANNQPDQMACIDSTIANLATCAVT